MCRKFFLIELALFEPFHIVERLFLCVNFELVVEFEVSAVLFGEEAEKSDCREQIRA